MSGNKVNIPVLTLSLALIAGIAAGLLGWVYLVTKAPIAAALQGKTNSALSDVLPAFDNQPGDDAIVVGDVTFYVGRMNGEIVGFAGETITPKGYNGDITILAGVTLSGEVGTVLVTKQAETPGLGTVVCDRKNEKTASGIIQGEKVTGLPPNAILDQFRGMKVDAGQAPWSVEKDGGKLDAITGATITSRAVADGVFTIADTFTKNSDQLLKENN
jgi:Na+-translocating ferredoxin:NAD+ oxidoreductase subunit G